MGITTATVTDIITVPTKNSIHRLSSYHIILWPFKRHISLKESGILREFTDWHSHILPGVDDGVQTMEESLSILRLYEELGVKAVWLTPHIMEDIPNTTECLRERFAELQSAYQGSVKLYLASENMLDNLFEERLEADDLLPIGEKADHLLAETSYFSPPMNLYSTLERIRAKGYYPILAHPERYVYMNKEDYKRLKDMDVKFQINLPSLVGMYDRQVRDKAFQLLKLGFYELSGSDIHTNSNNVFNSNIHSDDRSMRSLVNIINKQI